MNLKRTICDQYAIRDKKRGPFTISYKKELQLIISSFRAGKTRVALKKALELKRLTSHPDLSNALGIIYRALQKRTQALREYEKAIIIQPQNSTYLNNKANILREMGFFNEAIKTYKLALKFNPQNTRFWCNLAKVCNDSYKFQEAEIAAKSALKIDPSYVEALNNLGLAFENQNKLQQALKTYETALAINPNNAIVCNNIGKLYFKMNKIGTAVKYTKNSIAINPNLIEPYYNLCEIYDKTNKLDEFDKILNGVPFAIKKDPSIKLKQGQLNFRKKRYSRCVDLLNGIFTDNLSVTKKSILYELLGKSFDHIGNYDTAFQNFSLMNKNSLITSKRSKIDANRYKKNLRELKKNFVKGLHYGSQTKTDVKTDFSPTFIIGFPRSGTTLLDTILRSHPNIEVMEELPLIDTLISTLKRPINPENIKKISSKELVELRKVYVSELERLHRPLPKEKMVIDKFPLNIIHVPLINIIFPNSKYILMIRHPNDCVLSCFMQNFELNEAMVNFLNLQNTAEMYSDVMELWSAYSERLDLDVKIIKYEELIGDLKTTSVKILDFLGLDWNENLLSFYKTGRGRKKIMTPSYNQVTEKLYNHAAYRWKNYKKNISKEISCLKPWLEYFSYSD